MSNKALNLAPAISTLEAQSATYAGAAKMLRSVQKGLARIAPIIRQAFVAAKKHGIKGGSSNRLSPSGRRAISIAAKKRWARARRVKAAKTAKRTRTKTAPRKAVKPRKPSNKAAMSATTAA